MTYRLSLVAALSILAVGIFLCLGSFSTFLNVLSEPEIIKVHSAEELMETAGAQWAEFHAANDATISMAMQQQRTMAAAEASKESATWAALDSTWQVQLITQTVVEATLQVPLVTFNAQLTAWQSTKDANDINISATWAKYTPTFTATSTSTATPTMTPTPAMPLPSQHRIAFVAESQIYISNADGSELVKLPTGDNLSFPDSLAWSPDGKRIFFHARQGSEHRLFSIKTDRTESPIQLLPDLSALYPALSPDGKNIAFVSNHFGTYGIVIAEIGGSNIRPLFESREPDAQPDWSPNGTRIVFARNQSSIYVFVLATNELINLTSDSSSKNFDPHWSPDGRRIVFVSKRDGDSEIFVMDSDGANVTQLTFNDYSDEEPAWSPNGKYISYQSKIAGKLSIHIMTADGSMQTQFPVWFDVGDPAWKP